MTARGTTTTGSSPLRPHPSPAPAGPPGPAPLHLDLGVDQVDRAWRWSCGSSCGPSWSRRSGFRPAAWRTRCSSGTSCSSTRRSTAPRCRSSTRGCPRCGSRERNDILVFDSVEEEGLKVVKRLIGMPGDTLAMEGGVSSTATAQRVDEPYALHSDPHRSEDPIQRAKMRRVAGAAPGAAGHGRPTSPTCRTGGRSSCRPIRSS